MTNFEKKSNETWVNELEEEINKDQDSKEGLDTKKGEFPPHTKDDYTGTDMEGPADEFFMP